MSNPWQIMIASSNLENRRTLVRILSELGIDPICASTATQCREILGEANVGLVFCDRFFTDGDYQDVLAAAGCKSTKGEARVVLISILADSEQYEKAKRQGIFEIISTPCRPTDVEWMVIRAKRDEHKRARSFPPAGSDGARRTVAPV